jgi:molecular chaperone GrpE
MASKKNKKDNEPKEKESTNIPVQDKEVKEPKAKDKKKEKAEGEDEFTELQEKYEQLNDKYTRLYSDFDNYRKRSIKERVDTIKTAAREVIEDLLPVLDDFERALQSMREQDADPDAVQGVELIYNKLFNTLKQKGLEPMDSLGKEFNTDYHDAVTQIPAEQEEMKGKVFDVITRGYLLNGAIIRHAKVVVSV